jgi:hypothetical protein
MKPKTCACTEYRESTTRGVCACAHDKWPYHKRGVGPCWYPVTMAS